MFQQYTIVNNLTPTKYFNISNLYFEHMFIWPENYGRIWIGPRIITSSFEQLFQVEFDITFHLFFHLIYETFTHIWYTNNYQASWHNFSFNFQLNQIPRDELKLLYPSKHLGIHIQHFVDLMWFLHECTHYMQYI
jgi:hypothetical protein